ncbi:hypothetical protein [Methanococcus voltae]|uniref:Uncharacterized protein n=1 Tax=Methanococcus voltae (strain ATCC BAA-1334 / A3) TaxID=456320 RepID=D7DSK8_METV3|nr:hypothetical protein [Methanococcus voltae]MCS3901717.1 hypothetical protein [Methanococcus voltae]
MLTGSTSDLSNINPLDNVEGCFIYCPAKETARVRDYLNNKQYQYKESPAIYAEFTEFILMNINYRDWINLKRELASDQMPTSSVNDRMSLSPTIMEVPELGDLSVIKVQGLEGSTYKPFTMYAGKLNVYDSSLIDKVNDLKTANASNTFNVLTNLSEIKTAINEKQFTADLASITVDNTDVINVLNNIVTLLNNIAETQQNILSKIPTLESI